MSTGILLNASRAMESNPFLNLGLKGEFHSSLVCTPRCIRPKETVKSGLEAAGEMPIVVYY